jgi:hypothetical protein
MHTSCRAYRIKLCRRAASDTLIDVFVTWSWENTTFRGLRASTELPYAWVEREVEPGALASCIRSRQWAASINRASVSLSRARGRVGRALLWSRGGASCTSDFFCPRFSGYPAPAWVCKTHVPNFFSRDFLIWHWETYPSLIWPLKNFSSLFDTQLKLHPSFDTAVYLVC